MEELIVKYLTDTLTPVEKSRFRAFASVDSDAFAAEFKRCLATLALIDLSLPDAGKNDELQCNLVEITRG